jgi:hypothetical protein
VTPVQTYTRNQQSIGLDWPSISNFGFVHLMLLNVLWHMQNGQSITGCVRSLHHSPYILWTKQKPTLNKNYIQPSCNTYVLTKYQLLIKYQPLIRCHLCTYKLAATYKMILMYFLVNIHINNQSTLYKVYSTFMK